MWWEVHKETFEPLVCVCVCVCVQACLVISRLASSSKALMKPDDQAQYLSWTISNLGSQVCACVHVHVHVCMCACACVYCGETCHFALSEEYVHVT